LRALVGFELSRLRVVYCGNEEKAACHLWCALEGRRYIPNLAKKLKESQEGAFVLQLDFPWYFLGSAAPG
jgi:hypothetical protein